jgi:hypothetical protein
MSKLPQEFEKRLHLSIVNLQNRQMFVRNNRKCFTPGSKVGTAICLFGAFLYQIVQKLPQKVLTFLFILLLLILPFDIENIVIFEEIFKEF